jgi:hypothetical protein
MMMVILKDFRRRSDYDSRLTSKTAIYWSKNFDHEDVCRNRPDLIFRGRTSYDDQPTLALWIIP